MLNILCKGRCHTPLEYIFLFLLSKSCTGISLNCSLLALMTTNLLSVHFFFSLKLCAYENRLGCQVGKTGKYNATRGKDGSTVNQPHTFVWLQWTDPDRAVTTDTTHILKQREHFYWQVNLPLPVLIVEMNFTSNLKNLLPRAPLYQMLNNKIMLLMTQKRYTRLFREGLSKKQKNAHYYPEM